MSLLLKQNSEKSKNLSAFHTYTCTYMYSVLVFTICLMTFQLSSPCTVRTGILPWLPDLWVWITFTTPTSSKKVGSVQLTRLSRLELTTLKLLGQRVTTGGLLSILMLQSCPLYPAGHRIPLQIEGSFTSRSPLMLACNSSQGRPVPGTGMQDLDKLETTFGSNWFWKTWS